MTATFETEVDDANKTALHHAVQWRAPLSLIQKLLDKSRNPATYITAMDRNNMNTLHYSVGALKTSPSVVQLLLDYSPAETLPTLIASKSSNQCTALIYATNNYAPLEVRTAIVISIVINNCSHRITCSFIILF